MSAKPGDCGFTLLEVVVAFSILAVSLAVIFHAFGTGASNARFAEQYTIATLMAESRLAAAGVERPLDVGASAGRLAGPYRWRSVVTPIEDDYEAQPVPPSKQLYEVTMTIEWGEGTRARAVTLRTYRFGAVE